MATRQPEEVETLAAELGSVYGPLVIVAYCGLRPSELIALESRGIDRAEGVLRVERAYSYGREVPEDEGQPSTCPVACEGAQKCSRRFHDALTRGWSSLAAREPHRRAEQAQA